MVRQLTERNTITIPKAALKIVHAKPGDFFEITGETHRIVLTPKVLEDPFTDEEWVKLRKLAKQPGTRYLSAREAKRHLDRLIHAK